MSSSSSLKDYIDFYHLYFGVMYDSYDGFQACYKTFPCTDFQRGHCRNGHNCFYIHACGEKRQGNCLRYIKGCCNVKDCPYLHEHDLPTLPRPLEYRIRDLISLKKDVEKDSASYAKKKRKLEESYVVSDHLRTEIDDLTDERDRLHHDMHIYKEERDEIREAFREQSVQMETLKEQLRAYEVKVHEINKGANFATQTLMNILTVKQHEINQLKQHLQDSSQRRSLALPQYPTDPRLRN